MKTSEFLTSLVTSSVTITINGQEVELLRPEIPEALKVHEQMEPVAGETPEQRAIRSFRVYSMALNACLAPDDQLDDETAQKVILASGGLGGDLVKTTMRLCGLNMDMRAPTNDPPTS